MFFEKLLRMKEYNNIIILIKCISTVCMINADLNLSTKSKFQMNNYEYLKNTLKCFVLIVFLMKQLSLYGL